MFFKKEDDYVILLLLNLVDVNTTEMNKILSFNSQKSNKAKEILPLFVTSPLMKVYNFSIHFTV